MPNQKFHVGYVRSFPGIEGMFALMQAHGCPATAPKGLIDVGSNAANKEIWGTLVTASAATIKKLNRQDSVVEEQEIEKDHFYPFLLREVESGMAVIEAYAGGAKIIDKIGSFLAEDMAAGCRTEVISTELLPLFERLQQVKPESVLQSAKVAGFKSSDVVVGGYSPRFASTQDGLDFMARMESEEATVKSIKAAYKGANGKVTIGLHHTCMFDFVCNPDDMSDTLDTMRFLSGVLTTH